MENQIYDVAIVGAGASGLMCALQAARRGLRVVLIESGAQVGRKVLASGNGRCNMTNAFVSAQDYEGTPALARSILERFSFDTCLHFFHELGVLTRQENQGRVFPLSGKSTAVVEPLRLACEEAQVEFRLNTEITHIRKTSHFLLTSATGASIAARNCVLACGSCAYPQLGGTKAGYLLAASLGHHLIEPRPTLCALHVKEKSVARLQGIRLQGKLSLPQGGQSEGEILFAAYGLSGPAALNISSQVGQLLSKGPVTLTVDLLPEIADKKKFLVERIKIFGARKPKAFLAGLLHENIINLLIDFTGLHKNMPVSSWTENTLQTVARNLAAWPFTVTSLRPWQEAMVAAGGVKCVEINYNTLESLCCPGLYIIGELLDVNGRSGGFNLHFAWGCGYVAAQAIAEE